MPRVLKLVQIEVLDTQDGPNSSAVDELRIRIVLDGRMEKFIKCQLHLINPPGIPPGNIYKFTSKDNKTDPEMTGRSDSFVYWSTADFILVEADKDANTTVDTDLDEWIQTVRLDHPIPASGVKHEVIIGGRNEQSSLMNGRSDAKYRLIYEIRTAAVHPDPSVLQALQGNSSVSEHLLESDRFGDLRKDKGDSKWICSIDGGGLRGIFVLRMLEQLESYYGKSCFEIFDMFAGTSTGSIIAALLSNGYPLRTAINLYTSQTIRNRIFSSNSEGQKIAFRFLDLSSVMGGSTSDDINDAMYPQKISDLLSDLPFGVEEKIDGAIDGAAQHFMAPRYRKTEFKELLFQLLSTPSGTTLIPRKMHECGLNSVTKDIFITARDLQRNETTYFTAFHFPFDMGVVSPPVKRAVSDFLGNGPASPLPHRIIDVVTGTYKNANIKDVVEASAAAPVYFGPRSQFTDGGVGVTNNPAFAASIEALRFSHIDTNSPTRQLTPKYKPYRETATSREGTVVWSFGTAFTDKNTELPADISSLIGGSLSLRQRTDTVLYWIDQVIENLMFGANREQDFLCRELLADKIKYLRFNLGLNRNTLTFLNVSMDRDVVLSAIGLDSADAKRFDIMDDVAKKFALHVRERDFGFDSGGVELQGQTNFHEQAGAPWMMEET